ncbi:MAG: hypothetical protein IPF52_18200 [Saprospiraceae bacterium]|nr:hypothetical protein [Saprospiraceae bacterium]
MRTKLFLTLFLVMIGLSLNGQYFLGLSKTELIKDLNSWFLTKNWDVAESKEVKGEYHYFSYNYPNDVFITYNSFEDIVQHESYYPNDIKGDKINRDLVKETLHKYTLKGKEGTTEVYFVKSKTKIKYMILSISEETGYLEITYSLYYL